MPRGPSRGSIGSQRSHDNREGTATFCKSGEYQTDGQTETNHVSQTITNFTVLSTLPHKPRSSRISIKHSCTCFHASKQLVGRADNDDDKEALVSIDLRGSDWIMLSWT